MVTEIYNNIDETNTNVKFCHLLSEGVVYSCRNEWEKRKQGRFTTLFKIRNLESVSNQQKYIVKKW